MFIDHYQQVMKHHLINVDCFMHPRISVICNALFDRYAVKGLKYCAATLHSNCHIAEVCEILLEHCNKACFKLSMFLRRTVVILKVVGYETSLKNICVCQIRSPQTHSAVQSNNYRSKPGLVFYLPVLVCR